MQKRILIVDDEPAIRDMVAFALRKGEYEPVHAGDAREAQTAIADQTPDLILLDWNMPVMTGIEFLRRLRKMSGGDAPKVVFCTTENDLAHIQEALSAGANEYIMKPFDSDIIQTKFAQVGLI